MSKHTPGPWTPKRNGAIVGGPFHQLTNGSAQSQVAMATVPSWEDDPTAAQESNARLIAAAPELLGALELAVACGMVPISSAMEGGACAYSIQAQVADKIRAAIAKATGAAIPEEGE